MIKFFRKIRQKLIIEGNIRNYFFYAIGEITLVVIGILIALQISAWSAEYKERQLEYTYYNKLLEDVIQDELLLKNLLAENELRIKANNEMLHLLQQDRPSRKEVMKQMRGAITKITFTFKPNKSAFEDLKSSGNFNILKDLQLKNRLLDYYTVVEGFVDVIDTNADATVSAYFNSNKDMVAIGWQDIEHIRNDIDTTIVDTKKLEDPSFPSPEIRKLLLSDAILFLGVNSRIKDLYQDLQREIAEMRKVLEAKCEINK